MVLEDDYTHDRINVEKMYVFQKALKTEGKMKWERTVDECLERKVWKTVCQQSTDCFTIDLFTPNLWNWYGREESLTSSSVLELQVMWEKLGVPGCKYFPSLPLYQEEACNSHAGPVETWEFGGAFVEGLTPGLPISTWWTGAMADFVCDVLGFRKESFELESARELPSIA